MITITRMTINNSIGFLLFLPNRTLGIEIAACLISEDPQIEQISLPPRALSAIRFCEPHLWQDLLFITNYFIKS